MNFGKRVLATGGMILALSVSSATAASFDCRKASTDIEHEICDDPVLSELDAEMGRLYHKAKDIPGMKQEQHDWIKFRNRTCESSNGCLIGETKRRISDLKEALGGTASHHSSSHSNSTHHPKGNVYFPERGIVCDKKSGFCADKEGISLGYTQEYLGEEKAIEWEKRLSSPTFDKTRYTMSNGIYCESETQQCYNNRWKDKVDRHYTDMLFR